MDQGTGHASGCSFSTPLTLSSSGADFGGANEQRGRRRTGRRAKPQAAAGEDAEVTFYC